MAVHETPRNEAPKSKPWLGGSHFHYGYVAAGFLTLFGSSYLDSVRGPLLPVISKDLAIDYAQMGWFLTIGNIAAIAFVSGLLLLINKFSERFLTICILVLASVASAFAFAVTGFWSLLAFGLTLGASISLMGTMCNLLTMKGTPVDARPKVLAGSHMMYGLGCVIAPLAVSAALRSAISWKWLVSGMAIFFIALATYVFNALPAREPGDTGSPERLRLSGKQWLAVAIFMTYVAGEVLTSMWMTAFLTEAKGFSVPEANEPLMIFFGCIALSRLACFIFLKPQFEKWVILGSLIASFSAFLLGYLVWEPLFGLCGLAGPFYPVFLGRVARTFPAQWRAISIWINIVVQLGLALFHVVVGRLAQVIGLNYSYLIAPLMLFVTLLLAEYFIGSEEKQLAPQN